MSSPQCSRVAILDDDILEGTESKLLRLTLSNGGHHVQFEEPSTVYVTIMDDDGTQRNNYDIKEGRWIHDDNIIWLRVQALALSTATLMHEVVQFYLIIEL